MPIAHLVFLIELHDPAVAGLLLLEASATTPTVGAAATGINAAGVLNFFTAILTLLQTVGLPAFGVSAAWAGFQLMFSTSPRHQDGAKEQLKWSVIGLVIVLAANQVGDIIKQAAGMTGSGG